MATVTVKQARSVIEGKTGDRTQMVFNVKLSEAAAEDVTVRYTTADNAKAKNAAEEGIDYTATSGPLKILAGTTSGQIKVEVIGDGLKEGDEVFDLILSNPTGAGFATGTTLTVVGTIIDDEPIIYFP